MRYLLDTHLVLWAAIDSERLSPAALAILADEQSTLVFSAASLWEVAIKTSLGRPEFTVDPHLLRRGLIQAGYEEMAVTGAHAVTVADLPALHKDPFDRVLVGQARAEGLILVTSDAAVARYPGDIQLV